MRIVGALTSGVTAGGTGTANDTSTVIVTGLVYAVYVQYNDSPGAGTDVTVATSGTRHPAVTLHYKENHATDHWAYPVIQNTLNSDGTAVTGSYTAIPIDDTIKVTIAGAAGNGDSASVYLLVD